MDEQGAHAECARQSAVLKAIIMHCVSVLSYTQHPDRIRNSLAVLCLHQLIYLAETLLRVMQYPPLAKTVCLGGGAGFSSKARLDDR